MPRVLKEYVLSIDSCCFSWQGPARSIVVVQQWWIVCGCACLSAAQVMQGDSEVDPILAGVAAQKAKVVSKMALDKAKFQRNATRRKDRDRGQASRKARAWQSFLARQIRERETPDEKFKIVIDVLAQLSGLQFNVNKITDNKSLVYYVLGCMKNYARTPGATQAPMLLDEGRGHVYKSIVDSLDRLHQQMGEVFKSANMYK